MDIAIKTIEDIFGTKPLGWYTGRCSVNTRDLVIENGGFFSDCDFIILPSSIIGNHLL